MRLSPLLCLAVLTLFASCSKDDDSMPCEPTVDPNVNVNYIPMTIGDYWIYDRYNTDFDGENMTFAGQDSTVIEGDTVINGLTYYQHVSYKLTSGGFINSSLAGQGAFRDSSGYLIDAQGTIFFSASDDSDSLAYSIENLSIYTIWRISSMNLLSQLVSVEAGNFNCLAYSTRIETDDPGSQDNFPKYNSSSYAPGVGRVRFNLNYFSGQQKVIYELNNYNVQ